MNYTETLDYLFHRQQKGMKLGLDTTEALMDRLGHPERRFPSIHIAGTNGKGSTAAMLESILRRAGYRTGLYTSPHLTDMRERIRIQGQPVSEADVVVYTERLLDHVESLHASYFETLTALAFLCFAEQGVDAAVLETGLGGRLDATNVVHPVLSCITRIGLEHTKILGRTFEAIAKEKAGILKPGIPCVVGANTRRVLDVFQEAAAEKNSPYFRAVDIVQIGSTRLDATGTRFDAACHGERLPDLFLGLAGKHQIENARLVLAAIDCLRKQGWTIPESAVREGLQHVVWRARLELLLTRPQVLLDSAHNPLGIRVLVQALRTLYRYDRLVLLFGVLEDKNYSSMIERIAPLADRVFLTRPQSERALEPTAMVRLPSLRGKDVRVIADISRAWQAALRSAGQGDLVCCTGSIYLVGEVIRLSS